METMKLLTFELSLLLQELWKKLFTLFFNFNYNNLKILIIYKTITLGITKKIK